MDIIRNTLLEKYNLGWPISEDQLTDLLAAAEIEQGIHSPTAADAHMLLGLWRTYQCHWSEAGEEFQAAHQAYLVSTGSESKETASAVWALAHINAYLVYFATADDLYQDAVALLFRAEGGVKDVTAACLRDYQHFLAGFARDERGARDVEWLLQAVVG